jgi:hypothetical protein
LEGIAVLKKSDPSKARQLRVVFIGEGTEAIGAMAARLDISDVVETRGVIPFSEVSQFQAQAHALLAMGCKPFRGYEFGGSKVFGYLKAGRPIIGVLPRDEGYRVLQSVGVQTIADVGSVDKIVAVFYRLLAAWAAGDLSSLLPDAASCEAFSAERQTRALVLALEGKPAQDPFLPGSTAMAPSVANFIGDEGWVQPA